MCLQIGNVNKQIESRKHSNDSIERQRIPDEGMRYTQGSMGRRSDMRAVDFSGSAGHQEVANPVPQSLQAVQSEGKNVVNREKATGNRVWKCGDVVLAEVNGDTACEVKFSNQGLDWIVNSDLREKALQNNGVLKSEDILTFVASKRSSSGVQQDGAEHQETLTPVKKREKWTLHRYSYKQLINMGECIVKLIDDFCMNRKVDLDIVHFYRNLMLEAKTQGLFDKYAGKDYMTAILYSLNCIDKDNSSFFQKGKHDRYLMDCKLEMNRRLEEMKHESEFCKLEETMEAPDDPDCTLYGNDCIGFASTSKSFFVPQDDTRQDALLGSYPRMLGYTEHQFVWITKEHKANGGVTVETCAGKGGKRRIVFSLRPSPDAKDSSGGLSVKEDMESISNGYLVVNKDAIRKNPMVMEAYFKMFQSLLEGAERDQEGKINALSQDIRNCNCYKLIIDFYYEYRNAKKIPSELRKLHDEVDNFVKRVYRTDKDGYIII